MSGFVAAVTSDTSSGMADALHTMSQKISHRGNQERADKWSDRCLVIARDRKQSGYRVETYQNSAYGIALDGLLSNTDELRLALGAKPESSAAEIVLKGFQKFGKSWLVDLDGCFALMIVNLQSGETILARDRFGHRPLYFAARNGDIWVGSEIKPLLAAPGYVSSINTDNLYSSIAFGLTPGPQTLFSSIYKVVPGFVFRIDARGNYELDDYYTPTLKPRTSMSAPEAREAILANLTSSVEHYVRECPAVGTMLSSGVDSALLAHLSVQCADDQVAALSFGADDWPADESIVARDIATQLGMNFTRSCVPTNSDLLGPLREVVSILEEPTRFENALALHFLAQDAANNCTAVMTGEGADYILGQHEHLVAKRLSRILRIPAVIRRLLHKMPLEKLGIWQLRAISNYLGWESIRDYDHKVMANCSDLVAGFDGPPHIETVALLGSDVSEWPVEAQFTYIELRDSAHCWIERMEKIPAASRLECFHPFETNSMLQLSFEMPNFVRNADGLSKPALRSIAADIFGESFAHRQKQQLAAPMQLWLDRSKQLRAAVLKLKDSDSRIRQYLDQTAVDKYLDIYEREGARSKAVAVPIFRMLTFEIWLEQFH